MSGERLAGERVLLLTHERIPLDALTYSSRRFLKSSRGFLQLIKAKSF